MSDAGGLTTTVFSLCRRGLLAWQSHKITAAGRRALAEADPCP